MMTPDVRVRLSAEGTAEVVAALKKVQAEGEKTGRAGRKSFLGLNSVLGSTANLLGGLGIAVGVGSFVGFIKRSAEATDQTGKLSQKVGASVENLSALNLAAVTADVGVEQLTVGLTFLNRRIAELLDGSPEAQAVFRKLGLSARDFKGKDAVQAFELVSQRIAQMGDGALKTKASIDIFGRSGAQLIPLMNDLAEEGLGRLIERARDLGVLLSDDMVAAAQKVNDDFSLLKLQAQGLGVQFATGVAPSISQALQIISGDLSQTTDSWKQFGEGVGAVLKFIVAVVASAVDVVGTAIGGLLIRIDAAVRAAGRLARLDFKGARRAWDVGDAADAEAGAKLKARLKGRFQLAFQAPQPGKLRERSAGGDADSAELARRQGEAARSVRDAELSLLKAQLKARGDAEKRSYDQGLSSLHEYYEGRRRIIAEGADAEVAALLAKRALLSTEPDKVKAGAEAKAIDVQVSKARLEQESAIAALTFEEAEALKDTGQKVLAIEGQIAEMQGRRYEAALAGIQQQTAEYDELLRKQGIGDAERAQKVKALNDALLADANFEQARREADAALDQIALRRSEIEAQVKSGQLTEVQGEAQLLEIEKQRLPILQQLAQALLVAAEATGDAEKTQQARELSARIKELGVRANELKTQIQLALTDDFANWLATVGNEAESLGQAMKNLAASVVQSLRTIAAQKIAEDIFGGLFKSKGGVVGEKKAGGGLLHGPGTGTSDSIPMWGSRGEFVTREAVVSQPGALKFLESFNRWGMAAIKPIRSAMPRFPQGGVIGGATPSGRALDGRLTIGLEPGLVLRELQSPEAQRIHVQNTAKNRRAIQGIVR